MRFYHFKAVRCEGDWEFGVILGAFQMRVARSQFAMWWNHEALIDLRYGYQPRMVWFGSHSRGGAA